MSEEIEPLFYLFGLDENGHYIFQIETDEDYNELGMIFDEDV